MKNRVFIIVIIVIFLAGIAGSVWVWSAPAKSRIRVVSNEEIVYSADLNTAEDTTSTPLMLPVHSAIAVILRPSMLSAKT